MTPPKKNLSAFEIYNQVSDSGKLQPTSAKKPKGSNKKSKQKTTSNYEENLKVKEDLRIVQRALKEKAHGTTPSKEGRVDSKKSPAKKLIKKSGKMKKPKNSRRDDPIKMISSSNAAECSDNDSEPEVPTLTKRKGSCSSMDDVDSEILDGDDVPLVEELMSNMSDSDNDFSSNNGDAFVGSAGGLNGDNFMSAVLNSNSEMIEKTKKVTVNKEKAKNSKKRRSETLATSTNGNSKKRRNNSTSDLTKLEEGSVEAGKKYLEWIINPVEVKQFMNDSWEKRPLHIKRGQKNYFKDLFSTKAFDSILREKNVVYGKNLDVTSYDGERDTHNPAGRAYPPVVWDFYNNGCSLRMLNPQTFHEPIWKACATLQELFGSMVGANIYLTPPGTQGFAPHYDDVEVFILQIEGKKRWRLYEPKSKNETLPRFSSPNFTQEEIGEPCMDLILGAGDMLYFPRGTIHQGNCLDDEHSLHITLSCHQLNSFGDLLLKIVPQALETAMEESQEFRKGLPWDYLSFMGVANSANDDEAGSSDKSADKRRKFMSKVEKLMGKLFEYSSVDAAADQLGKRFIRDTLPPHLTQRESARTVENDGEKWNAGKNEVVNRVEIDPDTEIRLVRQHCLRLCVEDEGAVRVYYNVDNTREFHETDELFLEVEAESAAAVEFLIDSYPNFVKAEDLPMDEQDGIRLDDKMRIVQDLWEKKVLMTRKPLESHYDD